MKIGQPKLSERESQRSGLFVRPTNVCPSVILEIEDYGLKGSINDSANRRAPLRRGVRLSELLSAVAGIPKFTIQDSY